jgi:hypothetical protein
LANRRLRNITQGFCNRGGATENFDDFNV